MSFGNLESQMLDKHKSLVAIDISDNKEFVGVLPENLTTLEALQEMNMSGCNLRVVPADLFIVTQLVELNLDNNFISELPASLSVLTNLVTFSMKDNKVVHGDKLAVMGSWPQLELVDLSENPLKTFPECIGHLQKLNTLVMRNTAIRGMPAGCESLFRPLSSLIEVDLSDSKHLTLNIIFSTDALCHLPALMKLVLNNVQLSKENLPDVEPSVFQGLRSLRELYLSQSLKASGGTKFLTVLASNMPQLRILNISHNNLKSVPDEMVHLSNISELNVSYNQLWDRSLSDVIFKMEGLVKLYLVASLNTESNAKQGCYLPANINQLKQLRELDVSENIYLKDFPPAIAEMESLEVILFRDSSQLDKKYKGLAVPKIKAKLIA